MSKQKYYGILMGKYQVHSDIHLFTPNYIISGQLEENKNKTLFVDDIGNKYFLASSVESVFSNDILLLVSYLITEEELLLRYSGSSLKEAMHQYLQEVLEYVHVGYYQLTENRIVMQAYNVHDLLNIVDEKGTCFIGEGKESFKPLKENEKIQANSPQGEVEFLNKLKSIVKIEDEKRLRSELEVFLSQILSNQSSLLPRRDFATLKIDFNNLNGQKITEFFDAFCKEMVMLETMDSIYEEIKVVDKNLHHLILEFEISSARTDHLSEAIKILGRIRDSVFIIAASGDAEQVKLDIMRLHREESEPINRVAKIYDILVMGKDVKEQSQQKMIINPKEMKDYFDSIIIGQEKAKRKVISSIIMNALSESCEDRNNCILVGPTGSGKTLIVETASKYLDIPMEIVDTTQHTIPGYTGANIEEFLARLLDKAGGDKKKAEHGIVVFDELDKKGSDKKDDVSGKGVLNTLLNFIHGTNYSVKYNGKTVDFNTSHLTIFATGAFSDVAKAKLKKTNSYAYKETSIGFNTELNFHSEEDIEYPDLTPADFIEYGQIPDELMGRLNVIVQLSGHTRDTLKRILTDSEVSPLLIEKRKLEKLGISMEWTDEFLDEVVENAMKEKEGARSLKRVIEKTIDEVRWEVLTNCESFRGIRLIKQSVENPRDCQILDQNGFYRDFRMLFEEVETSSEVEKVRKMGTLC